MLLSISSRWIRCEHVAIHSGESNIILLDYAHVIKSTKPFEVIQLKGFGHGAGISYHFPGVNVFLRFRELKVRLHTEYHLKEAVVFRSVTDSNGETPVLRK